MNITKQERNGVPYICISDPEKHYTQEYFTHNNWLDEDTLIIGEMDQLDRTENGRILRLFLVNLVEGTKKLVVEKTSTAILVYGRTLYHAPEKTLYAVNLDTLESEEIYTFEKKVVLPHITNDGRYMSFEYHQNGCDGGYVLDLKERKLVDSFTHPFHQPFPMADHVMICPTDHTKVFFAHEGDTRYISNRLWLHEKGKGERCIAKQRLDEDGNLGDCFGHECWAPDGKGLWFVKYRESTLLPIGLSYVDMEGNQKNAVYGKYPYWHVGCSADGRYLGADAIAKKYDGPRIADLTDEEMERIIECDCCVVDLATGEERSVIKVLSNSVHPCHPHPAFSPNSKWLAFHDFVDGQVTVGFVNLEDVL